MDSLAAGFQQSCHGILRQPVDLQVRVQLAQLARDGDVAAPVPEPERGGEIEYSLGFPRRSVRSPCRGGDAELAIEEIDDQSVDLCRKTTERIVAAAFNGHQLGPGDDLGHRLCARITLDLVV